MLDIIATCLLFVDNAPAGACRTQTGQCGADEAKDKKKDKKEKDRHKEKKSKGHRHDDDEIAAAVDTKGDQRQNG